MAADDDGDVFEITDFTTASDWERFISRVEEILHEWKLVTSSPKLPAPKDSYASGKWEQKTEEIDFSRFKFEMTHIWLVQADDQREKSAEKESAEDESETASETEQMPTVHCDLMNMENDFPSKAHCLCRWYGLQDFVTVSPGTTDGTLLTESHVKSILSSVSIALADAGCSVPVFVQAQQKWRRLYHGVCVLPSSNVEFAMVYLKHAPPQYNHLAGLLDVFKSKMGCVVDQRPPVSVAVRFVYVLYDWINSPWSQPFPDFDGEVGCTGFDKLPFGACEDPVSALHLYCTWPSLSEDMIVENQVYSDLDPLQAPHWSVRIEMTEDPQCLLGEYLTSFLALSRRKETLEQIVNSFGGSDLKESDSTGDISSALQRLTEPSMSYNISSIGHYVAPQAQKPGAKPAHSLAPVQGELLNHILQYLFPDSVKSPEENSQSDTEETTGSTSMELPKQLKSAPVEGLLYRLSVCLCMLHHNHGGVQAVAQIWQEFVMELRYRWDHNYAICGVESGPPNLGSCLLQQKLQMLNCCIEHKKKREQLHKGYTGDHDSPPASPFRGPSTSQVSRSLSSNEDAINSNMESQSSDNEVINSSRDNPVSNIEDNAIALGACAMNNETGVGIRDKKSSSMTGTKNSDKSSAISKRQGRPSSFRSMSSGESSDEEFFECNDENNQSTYSDEKDIDTTAEDHTENSQSAPTGSQYSMQQTTGSAQNANQSDTENTDNSDMECEPDQENNADNSELSPASPNNETNPLGSISESHTHESLANISMTSESSVFRESYSHKPAGRLALFQDLRLVNCDEKMYIPVTQEPAPMTEDMLEEHAEILAKLGTSAEGAQLRARMQSACLLSDMESFKAANPGCVLEDFVRWYSPRDWVEETVEGADGEVTVEGHLSQRMQIPGNMWVEVWQTARPVPARRQKRLFDDTREAEKVLHFLSSLKLSDVVLHLMPMLVHAALLRSMENEDKAIPVLHQVIEQACLKASQITRSPQQDSKRYEDLIRLIMQAEILIARNMSLKSKFTVDLLDHSDARQELEHFVGSILTQPEVSVRGGPMGPAGSVITKLFNMAQKANYMILDDDEEVTPSDAYDNHSHDDQSHNSSVPSFPRPTAREYILRTIVPRPAPYSKPLPQRMFCSIQEDEFRMAGAFGTDSVFQ